MTHEDEVRKIADAYASAARDLESGERDRIMAIEKINRSNARIAYAKKEFAKILSAADEREVHILLPMYNGRRDMLHVKHEGGDKIEVTRVNAII